MDALAALLAAAWWLPYAAALLIVMNVLLVIFVITAMWRRTNLLADIRDDVRAIRLTQTGAGTGQWPIVRPGE